MAKERYKTLLDKSISAAISAIEIYNKPDFKYREETFSILMINAWEILLKAKILKDNNNDLTSIYIPEKTTNQRGEPLKRFFPKKNRAGNPMTIEIKGAMEKISIPEALKSNISLLIEIRDNSIHFMNNEKYFAKKILEIGTANLKSFVTVFNEWFDFDLSQYNFYLMPMSFYHSYEIESFSINKVPKQIQNLLQHISKKEEDHPSDINNEHNISLRLVTKFEKSSSLKGLKVTYDENAEITVKVEAENQFQKKYPLDYEQLMQKMRERYSNWKRNKSFWEIYKTIVADKKFSDERFLDMQKKSGIKKRYYSTEIFKEFNKHYTNKTIDS